MKSPLRRLRVEESSRAMRTCLERGRTLGESELRPESNEPANYLTPRILASSGSHAREAGLS